MLCDFVLTFTFKNKKKLKKVEHQKLKVVQNILQL